MKGIVLITGATAGIGSATALLFAKNKYNVIITGRRLERLKSLENQINNNYETKVLSLNFDIREYNEVKKHIDNLPYEWKNIDILINNAGLASGFGPIDQGDIEDWNKML
ncbi:MAG TPA: SDR family NAD(P)-dependent oxidoreductase, partial [Bacteroidales bacterium]|nr:SDR family NAD(P)-dependent oxidoreductase [Bacteroidales bacterium]